MELNKQLHQRLRTQNIVFALLFLAIIGMLAWLSTRYAVQSDWTVRGRNSLSSASRQIMGTLPGEVNITAFTANDRITHDRIDDLVNRYRRYKSDLNLTFVNPDTAPDKVRKWGISSDGELIIEYKNRHERVGTPSEIGITNALQRLSLEKENWILFLTGHGERSLLGRKNYDLGQFGTELQRKGFHTQPINLINTPDFPDNTSLLIIGGTRTDVLSGEVKLVKTYLDKGGNLLWLLDSSESYGMEDLLDNFGLRLLPGTVVDATTQVYGIKDPSFALVTEYPDHPITMDFDTLTVFPTATGIAINKLGGAQQILSTLPRSWTETGAIEGEIRFDANSSEHEGPINIGIALTRPGQKPDSTNQRIVVIGDGDFLSNRYLGNGDNQKLGMNIIQWLNHDDHFINIPPKAASDRTLNFSETSIAVIGLGFLVVLPATLFTIGGYIWYRRRNL